MTRKCASAFLILLTVCLFSLNGYAQIHAVDGRYVKEWLVLGPFFPDELETDFFASVGGEANIDPKAGDKVITAQGRTLTWERYHAERNSNINLLHAVGDHENAIAYAFCFLQSDASETVQVLLGSDDGVTVWMNGERVHHNPIDRPLLLNEDKFEVGLKAGTNRCLVKIGQDKGNWQFGMRVLPQDQAVIASVPIPVLSADVLMADTDTSVELYYNWKYHPGDNADWASPTFDDSTWETTNTWLIPNPKGGWNGIGWFRLHLSVEELLWNTPLALAIAYQAGASEIYLDGELVYEFGKVGTKKGEEEVYWEREPKVISFSSTTDHLIAIRYSNFSPHPYIPAGFGLKMKNLNPSVEARVVAVRKGTIFQMVWTAIPVFLALQNLLLFLFYPRSRENLYFAISTASIGAFVFLVIQFVLLATSATQVIHLLQLLVVVFVLMFLSGMLFLYSLFYSKLPKQFWVFLLGWVIDGGLSLYYLTGQFTSSQAIALVIILCVLAFVTILEMIRVIVVAIFKKKDGAWIFGIGSLATFILPMTFITLAARTKYEEIIGLSEFSWLAVILAPLFSMSVYLARNFARTNKKLETQLIRSKLLEVENTRKTQEFEEARQLQMSMLPQTVPSLPNLDIAFKMQPATEVGGDYYDFNLADDGTLTVAIGDATGHGINAGLVVSAVKSLFKTSANDSNSLQTLDKISQGIKSMNLKRLYMAMTLLTFKDSTITIAAAGMPPAFIYRAATKRGEEVLIEGLPLGSFIESQYQQKSFELQPGDTVLLMSDGLPEMLNPSDEMLDYPKTKALFETAADKTSEEIIAHLFKAGKAWANGRPQEDDVTFVVIKVKREDKE